MIRLPTRRLLNAARLGIPVASARGGCQQGKNATQPDTRIELDFLNPAAGVPWPDQPEPQPVQQRRLCAPRDPENEPKDFHKLPQKQQNTVSLAMFLPRPGGYKHDWDPVPELFEKPAPPPGHYRLLATFCVTYSHR